MIPHIFRQICGSFSSFFSAVKSYSCWCWCSWLIFGNVNLSLAVQTCSFNFWNIISEQYSFNQSSNGGWHHYDWDSGEIAVAFENWTFSFSDQMEIEGKTLRETSMHAGRMRIVCLLTVCRSSIRILAGRGPPFEGVCLLREVCLLRGSALWWGSAFLGNGGLPLRGVCLLRGMDCLLGGRGICLFHGIVGRQTRPLWTESTRKQFTWLF